MKLKKVLKQKKEAISAAWFDKVADTYPGKAAQFFKNEADSFDNPVGSTTRVALSQVFDLLISGGKIEDYKKSLDPVVRIRAVQDFSASKSVAFVFFLKTILKDQLKEELKDRKIARELDDLFSQIDGLALIAFDIYDGCREQIYALRAKHVRDRTLNLLKKADVLCEVPEVGTEIIPHNVFKDGGFEKK